MNITKTHPPASQIRASVSFWLANNNEACRNSTTIQCHTRCMHTIQLLVLGFTGTLKTFQVGLASYSYLRFHLCTDGVETQAYWVASITFCSSMRQSIKQFLLILEVYTKKDKDPAVLNFMFSVCPHTQPKHQCTRWPKP